VKMWLLEIFVFWILEDEKILGEVAFWLRGGTKKTGTYPGGGDTCPTKTNHQL